ncbi:MAG TPA: DciA family protein [Methylotenera sp.]|nr:DciA family protein [Methylotenera sp.]HPH05891.1 DciA family protein [Methylotenera sp.]HPN00673.1 DciA family protein [Methylotenera sp.]
MRQLNTLLRQPELNTLTKQAKQAATAQALWQTVAPIEIARFSHAIGVKSQQLLLFADNNAVAAKIKLLLPSLLIQLEKQGCEVTAIRVKVQVKSTPQPPKKATKKLSSKAAVNIKHLAEKYAGSPLGDALARLADRAN